MSRAHVKIVPSTEGQIQLTLVQACARRIRYYIPYMSPDGRKHVRINFPDVAKVVFDIVRVLYGLNIYRDQSN